MKASVEMPFSRFLREEGDHTHAKASNSSKDPHDMAILKLLLFLQVAGERKAEIEALLDNARPHLKPQDGDDDSHIKSKRSSFTKRWRKKPLRKYPSDEEDPFHKSTSSSAPSSTNSSIKSTNSVPSNQEVLCNGHENTEEGSKENAGLSDVTGDATVDMNMLQRLALNALNLTAPASSVLLRERRSSWVQLSGHPGSLAPAGPGTIWKKRGPDPMETEAYQCLVHDPASTITPTFFREILYQDEHFIEMQDLLYNFTNPCVMDIKMGTRTFLESEVSNIKARKDLYEKMIKVDIDAPTPEENEAEAVTKLRYMDFRDNMSSSRSLGFRIEALKMSGCEAVTELQTVRSRSEVLNTMSGFIKNRDSTRKQIIERLKHLREVFISSPFFQTHEVIGSSILIVYDDEKAGVWMIDFAKTVPVEEGVTINHSDPWVLGNHEEGYLTGIDNLIKVVEEVPVTKTRKLGLFHKS